MIVMHQFHILGVTSVFSGFLFSAMHDSLVNSSLIKETFGKKKKASPLMKLHIQSRERKCQRENIVAAHGNFGCLIFQYANLD